MTRWSFEPPAEPKQTVVTLKNGQQAKAILHHTTVDSVAYVGDCILSKSINGRIEYWEPKTEKVLFFLFSLFLSRLLLFQLWLSFSPFDHRSSKAFT